MLRAALISIAMLVCVLAPAGPAFAGDFEDALLREIDDARVERGLDGLREHNGLDRAADDQATWMAAANVLAHRPDLLGRLRPACPHQRLWGENLAWMPRGGHLAKRTVRAWLRSPPHRELLLTRKLDVVGVGAVGGDGGVYVAAEFAGR
jgi:uncharacterized protein YkwD